MPQICGFGATARFPKLKVGSSSLPGTATLAAISARSFVLIRSKSVDYEVEPAARIVGAQAKTSKLGEEAFYARTPAERRAQIPSIISFLNRGRRRAA
jgi:hypothetical protein